MWKRVKEFISTIETGWSLGVLIFGTGVVGLITGYVARGAHWLNQYGALGWWCTALIGAFVFSWTSAGVAWTRFQWIKTVSIRKWKEKIDGFNPLDTAFLKLRMRVSDIANPVTNMVDGKSFANCELIGPSNIGFIGSLSLSNSSFLNCNIVACREGVPINGMVAFKDSSITHCTFYNCTLFVPLSKLEGFLAIQGSYSISLTGNPEYDRRVPPRR